MGGKRSDQYAVDAGETQATDHTTHHDDQHLMAKEKAELATNPHHNEENMIPRRGTNPALAAMREQNAKRSADVDASDSTQGDS